MPQDQSDIPSFAADVEAWIGESGHLPRKLRDFHDQKDVFHAIHDLMDMSGNPIASRVDSVTAHTYVVDVFLHFMARRGYTLQRSRKPLPFRDLDADVALARRRRIETLL